MSDAQFALLSEICNREGVSLWRFADAPEDFRSLAGEATDAECLVHVPAHLIEDGDFLPSDPSLDRSLGFLNDIPKRPGLGRYAGDEWGVCVLHLLPDGGRVGILYEE